MEDTTYVINEKISDTEYKAECEQYGTVGNAYSGLLDNIDNISGVTAELTDILIPGEDEETDESLRQRYFESLVSQAYGGNITDYKQKVTALPGVGGVKVEPVWDGGGTVKLTIIDSDYNKPSDTLIAEVQTAVDPVQNQGEGYGITWWSCCYCCRVNEVENKRRARNNVAGWLCQEDVKPAVKPP